MSLAAIMMLSMVNVAAVVTFPRLSRVRHMPLDALQVTADRKRSFAPLCPPRMQTAHLRVRVHPMAHDRRRFFHPRTTTLRALASSPEPASSPELSREPVRRSRTMPRLSPYESALQSSDSPFRAWPRLNDGVAAEMAGVSRRQRLELSKPPLDALFAGDTLQAKLSRALAERRALDRKEFFETWEFFSQARGSLRCAPAESTDPPPPDTCKLLGKLFGSRYARGGCWRARALCSSLCCLRVQALLKSAHHRSTSAASLWNHLGSRGSSRSVDLRSNLLHRG